MNWILFRCPDGSLRYFHRNDVTDVDETYQILGFFWTAIDALRERDRLLTVARA